MYVFLSVHQDTTVVYNKNSVAQLDYIFMNKK